MASGDSQPDDKSIRKRTGAVDSLICYEITEDELNALVRGSPNSILKDVGISALSAGVGLFGSLITTSCEPASCGKFSILLALTVAGIILGAVFLITWQRTKDAGEPLVDRIKARISTSSIDTPPTIRPPTPADPLHTEASVAPS
jgi:hypothetical protein